MNGFPVDICSAEIGGRLADFRSEYSRSEAEKRRKDIKCFHNPN
jgi:uncharacterized small protein (DUF1192 family)